MQKQPRPGEYNLAEVVIAANKRITKEKIRPTDPRAKATVTARTVQFYLSKGLLPEPTRRGAQLRFDDRHVEAIVEVKRRQAEGLMLDEIIGRSSQLDAAPFLESRPVASRMLIPDLFTGRESRTSTRTMNVARLFADMPSPNASSSPVLRWHVALGNGFELSGPGAPPAEQLIAHIRTILQINQNENQEEEA